MEIETDKAYFKKYINTEKGDKYLTTKFIFDDAIIQLQGHINVYNDKGEIVETKPYSESCSLDYLYGLLGKINFIKEI